MRGPETGVAVGPPIGPVAGLDEAGVLLAGDCHTKTAKTLPSTINNTSAILAMAISKRQRFRGLRPPLPSLPSSSVTGGRGGSSPRLTSSGASEVARKVPAAEEATATVSSSCRSGSGGLSSSGPVATVASVSTGCLLPHKKIAG